MVKNRKHFKRDLFGVRAELNERVDEDVSNSARNLESKKKRVNRKQSHSVRGQAGGRGTLYLEAGGPDKSGSRGDDVIHLAGSGSYGGGVRTRDGHAVVPTSVFYSVCIISLLSPTVFIYYYFFILEWAARARSVWREPWSPTDVCVPTDDGRIARPVVIREYDYF